MCILFKIFSAFPFGEDVLKKAISPQEEAFVLSSQQLTRRTNQGFRSRIDPDHHSGKYQRNFILFKLFIF